MEPCLSGEAITAWCGTLAVPEDPSNAGGRKISLRVVVVPAAAAVAEPDPLFALAGGPGDAASQSLRWVASYFKGVHATRDVVLVDQRGTGGSNELLLPAYPDTAGLSAAAVDARWASWWSSYLGSSDADPRFYGSAQAADDVDAVRAALGYDRIDLYGPSYGATLVQYYLRQHPDHVRVAVLDGGTPLDVPIFERVAPNSQHALELLFARCATDAACHAAYPNIAAEFSTLWERLAKPETTNVTDPATGKPAVATRDSIAGAIHGALVTAESAARLPMAIHLAYEGDWAAASQAAAAGNAGAPDLLMGQVIRCSEAWARYDPASVERLGAGSYDLAAQLDAARAQEVRCRHLPRAAVPANDASPVRTSLPVLWVVGEADPQDPPSSLASVPQQMPNSRIVVVPGQGHTVGHLGCMPSIIDAFVVAGTARDLDVSCIAAGGVPQPAFATP